jgi:hypothetical protein
MIDDPKPLKPSKTEVQSEMFEQYHAHGLKSEDLPDMKLGLRKKFAKYLESQKA